MNERLFSGVPQVLIAQLVFASLLSVTAVARSYTSNLARLWSDVLVLLSLWKQKIAAEEHWVNHEFAGLRQKSSRNAFVVG